METITTDPAQIWGETRETVHKIRAETARVIVGQDAVVELMLTALLCKGHCLIVGVPGLAKTLLVSTLGRILGLKFHRIQFTPDLMPTDIVGSEILQTSEATGAASSSRPGRFSRTSSSPTKSTARRRKRRPRCSRPCRKSRSPSPARPDS